MLRKLFLTAIIALNLFAAGSALAAIPPDFNDICWKKAACEKINKTHNGFAPGEAGCVGGEGPDQWGVCLPAGKAVTAISFGGVREFGSIGEFISKNYNFAITVAAILAVIVIIMSGFQWTMSGGNSEVISTAKHRIGNAVIGLFIAYSSFFILNTINPDLVNLKMPKVYMVRPFSEIPNYCSLVQVTEDNKKIEKLFSFAAPATGDQKSSLTIPEQIDWNMTYNNVVVPDETNCGARYYYKGGGGSTCYGVKCPDGKSCVNMHFSAPTDMNYSCESGILFGRMRATYLIQPICGVIAGYSFPFIYDQAQSPTVSLYDWDHNKIYKVCRNPNNPISPNLYPASAAINTVPNAKDNTTGFFFMRLLDTSETCAGEGEQFLGYALGFALYRNCNGADNVAVDKFGYSLGKMGHNGSDRFWIYNAASLSSSSLFSALDFQNGAMVNIDIGGFNLQ
ncbi:MAG: hypothetical protein WC725_02630 [Patescibacteria group bacterium]|jgi:hypothetical protein